MYSLGAIASARPQAGSVRGVVYDKDFEAPLPLALVTLLETQQTATTGEQGNYSFGEVAPGTYTLVFSKEGYVRQVRGGVVVSAGQLTDVDAWLAGEFTDMEEFVVQDLRLGAGSEASLIKLRFESPALLDSIGSELLSRAGVGDAAGALRLVAGASVQDGKYAVIRGLPDRYVSSQMNGVRLPSADQDKRAVELDQFPSAVIESLQVSKTFTPDQQGDASGGAVDVRLKGIPDETTFEVKVQYGVNSSVSGGDFLTYEGGGLDTWGHTSGHHIQPENTNWTGAVGTTREDAPTDYKLSSSFGRKLVLDNGITVGGFASAYYERDSSFYDDGIDDSYWVETPGGPITPQQTQQSSANDFLTELLDVTQGTQEVKFGGLATLGLETERNKVGLTFLFTRVAEDKATLAINTRGKEFFFPGYDPNDPNSQANTSDITLSPYTRTETLEYIERTTSTLQLHGSHQLDTSGFETAGLRFTTPELGWTASRSTADFHEPDKRLFGALWHPATFNPGFPPFVPPHIDPAEWVGLKPDANFTLGNAQRIFRDIGETSTQYAIDFKWPFERGEEKGYVKAGVFNDHVEREFDQNTFTNFNDNSRFNGEFDDPWSGVFPDQDHPISGDALQVDIDYDGGQRISAGYGMIDMPITSRLSAVGGARFESTKIGIVNDPEINATWFPEGEPAGVALGGTEADVSFRQHDVLPALGLTYAATDELTLRASYSQTVARQTFKELTPAIQQEYLGAEVFVGNPDLGMSSLKNYDLRLDYRPYEGSLLSASWFDKDVEDAIEYVQRFVGFTLTTPRNYPSGELKGFELEARQSLGHWWENLDGLSLGGNATFIDSTVRLTDDEITDFANLGFPFKNRDMTNAPEHLYNVYATFDHDLTGTQLALFYTVQGDTLVSGAGTVAGARFVPSVYAKEYGTLNFSASTRLSKHWKVQFQAKNLTDPKVQEVYRSDFQLGGDQVKTSSTRGREFTISLGFGL